MKRVTVKCIRAGQPRPYADSEYVYEVVFEKEHQYGPKKGEISPIESGVTIKECCDAVRLLGQPFKTKDEKPAWHETRLEALSVMGRVSLLLSWYLSLRVE